MSDIQKALELEGMLLRAAEGKLLALEAENAALRDAALRAPAVQAQEEFDNGEREMSDTLWTDKHQWLSSPINMVVHADEVKEFERDCNAKIAALEAENAALREDAERYRWLRDEYHDTPIGVYEWTGMNGAQRRIFLGASELDEAIDAARKE